MKILNTRGVSMILVVIVLSTLLVAAAGVARIFTREVQLSATVDESVFAIMAADAGIEKKLYDIRKLDGDIETSYNETLSNGAAYTTCPTAGSCSPGRAISTGSFGEARRTFEITF